MSTATFNPVIHERPEGRGFTATTPPDHALRVGVVGESRDDASRLLRESVARWEALLAEVDD